MKKIVILVMLMCSTMITSAQIDYSPDNARLTYVRELETGETELVTITTTGENTLTIEDGHCYGVSDNLQRVAVTQDENPTNIIIYDLYTGEIINDIAWSSLWTQPCNFGWRGEDMLFITIQYDANGRTGYMIDALSGRASDETTMPDGQPSEFLPNLTPSSPLFLQSSNPDIYLYIRCTTSEIIPSSYGFDACYTESETAIYDINQQSTIEILRNGSLQFVTPNDIINFEETYSWSPSGRYIAYNSVISTQPRMIYDLENDIYLDTSDIQLNDYIENLSQNGMKWASDETRIAFWVNDLGSNTAGGVNLVIYELTTDEFTILPTEYVRSSYREVWGWMPDGMSVAVSLSDDTLITIGLDGTETIITDNVVRVLTNY